MSESQKPTTKVKRPIGRPTKLTPEIQAKMVMYLKRGNYVETSGHLCGLPTGTLYLWIKRGKEANAPKRYREFVEAIDAAIAEAEDNDVHVIQAASVGYKAQYDAQGNVIRAERGPNWKASAWRLERRHPRRWANKERLELTGKDGAPLGVDEKKIDQRIEQFAGLLGFVKKEDGK